MKEIKPVLKFDGEITPDDKLAIEIYSNADVDIKVKTNVVTGEDGKDFTDDEIMETTVGVFRAILSALEEYAAQQCELNSEEETQQMNVYMMRAIDE